MNMAAKVFVLILIQLCWTVAQSNTQPRDVTPRNASTKDFEVCQLDQMGSDDGRFIVYKQLSGSSTISDEKPGTDLWTSHCEIRYAYETNATVVENPLEYYKYEIGEVNIRHSNITSFPSEYFCHFSNLTLLVLTNNRLDDISKLGLGVNYGCERNNCGQKIWGLYLSGNPLRVIKNNSFCHLELLTYLIMDNCELTFIESGAFLQLKRLLIVDMSGNSLNNLDMGLFQGNILLSALMITNNRFNAINAVQNMTNLAGVMLSHNAITSVRKKDFINCANLQYLMLSDNNIGSIEEGAFDSFDGLRILNLTNNQLQSLNKTFLNSNIETLYLNNNKLTYICLFNFSRNIRNLYLRGNLISELSFDIQNLLQWQTLTLSLVDLSDNRLKTLNDFCLPRSVFKIILNNNALDDLSFEHNCEYRLESGQTSLQVVDLQNNSFSVVPVLPYYYIDNGKVIPTYDFSGNPLLCSCENTWFLKTSKTSVVEIGPPCRPSAKVSIRHFFPKDDVLSTSQLCESNYNDSNRCKINHRRDYYPQSAHLKGTIIPTECHFQCPPLCFCYTTLNFSVVHLYCSKAQLESVPRSFDREKLDSESEVILWLDGNNFNIINSTDFDIFPNVVQLYLNHSRIHTIHQLAFNILTALRVLSLNDNNLQTVQVGLFDHLTKLQELYLANNTLIDLPDETFNNLKSLQMLHLHKNRLAKFSVSNLKNLRSLLNVTLHRNNWSCECRFVINFRDYLDHHGAIVHNASNLFCTTEDEHSQKFILEFDKTLCVLHDKMIILAIIGSVCVILILSVSLSFYYRRELQLLIYSRVRRRVLSNVDYSEGKLFDVFVAYSNDDFDFVYHNILPGLEGVDNPYRVCVHERDFLAGCVIADNILEAVRISSRTIILLTDNFVRSGWCRFEFKAAHLQMLEDRCPRVLVIVVGHVPANLEPEMLLYLRTNTYLTWGEPFFWQKVYNSMPKQRATGVGVVRSPNLMPLEIEIESSV